MIEEIKVSKEEPTVLDPSILAEALGISNDIYQRILRDNLAVFDLDKSTFSEFIPIKEVESLIELTSKTETSTDIIKVFEGEAKVLEKAFNDSLSIALKQTRVLETAYRNIDIFFKNCNEENPEFLHIMNVPREELGDVNERWFFNTISDVIEEAYFSFDGHGSYSHLVIPLWGSGRPSSSYIEKWGMMADKYKVMLITDYRNIDDLKFTRKLLEKDNLVGDASYLQHVVLTYNQLIGRKRSELYNEERDLFVSSAAALAGLMHNSKKEPISQPRAGIEYGQIKGAVGLALELSKFDIYVLKDYNLIPFIHKQNEIFAWGTRNLFNGSNLFMQDYALVKTFDWIGKVLTIFVTNECFKRFTPKLKTELRSNIMNFLNDYMGSGKLIRMYDLRGITQDAITKNIVIDVSFQIGQVAKEICLKFEFIEDGFFNVDINPY